MQLLGFELPRIPIPRTPVNTGNLTRLRLARSFNAFPLHPHDDAFFHLPTDTVLHGQGKKMSPC